MRLSLRVFLSAAALAGFAAAGEEESIVRFANDDRLAGTVESLSSELLVLKSPLLDKPAPFFLRNVLDLSLPADLPEIKGDHVAILTLTNGDVVRGQLASVSDTTVALDTWYAGRMNFNRLMVSGVKIESAGQSFYHGPTGLEHWRQEDKPAWTYSRGAFVSRAAGSIGRDNLLADECSVSFDVAWKSDSLALKLVLFSDDPSSEGSSSGYELYFQSHGVTLRNRKTSGHIGRVQAPELQENTKVRVELRTSRKSGKICLFVNNRIVEVWTDPDFAKGATGKCLHFVSTNSMPIRISGIVVAPWDGKIDRMPDPRLGLRFGNQAFPQDLAEDIKPEPQEKPKEGRMELANGDSLTGDVVAIREGKITVKSPLGEVNIPVGRLRTINLKKADLERCIRRNGDIRAWFPDNTSVVFRLDGVGEGTLTGSSQNFGTATFKTAAFNRIEFNIYDVAMEDKRAEDDW